MEAQRVVLIQDASGEVSLSAIGWALHGLSLRSADKLILLGILHQANTPGMLSFMGGRKPVGCKSRAKSISMFGANRRNIDREVAMKKEEYRTNPELIQITKLFHSRKIEFKIEVVAGPTPKVVAFGAAERLKATWVILDRQMKKDKKYFMENLTCGISRMKHNNSIEKLRGPKTIEIHKFLTDKNRNSKVTYDEMIPGSPEEDDLFSIEIFPRSQTIADRVSQDQELMQSSSTDDLKEGWQEIETFEYSTCTICKNRRPKFRWRRNFTYSEIQTATDGFSTSNSLSEGGFGPVFRGQLECKLQIVVKKYNIEKDQGDPVFNSEFEVLSRAINKNVIMLLGSCTEGSNRLLVYEYACNGSLNEHLSTKAPAFMTWEQRMKVALGASRGLKYLHENNVIYKHMRSSNILLTHDFEPLLGDFKFAKEQYELDQSSENNVIRTFGYLAPEYAERQKLSDIYSFGVVLLELITGRRATDNRGETSLVGLVRLLLNERKYLEIVDHRISIAHDHHQLLSMVRIAKKCLYKNPKKRLSIEEVVSALECVADKKACDVIENISSAKAYSYSMRSMTELKDTQSYGGKCEQESLIKEVKSNSMRSKMGKSFSLPSSSSISTCSLNTSFDIFSSNTEKSYKMLREKSRSRFRVNYAEMLN